mgnify:CR=1 FL=1
MKKVVRVWFNHWFSTAYYIIDLLKKDEAIDFYVIGTNMSLDSPIKLMCDEWQKEPGFISDEEYLDFCLAFCKNNHIEVFVPKRGMEVICQNLYRFDELSVKVLVERDYEKFVTLKDKAKTYDYFSNFAPSYIPMYDVVNTSRELEIAYERIAKYYERVCIKFAQDEGARSFRVIDPSISENKGLYRAVGSKITLKQALSLLSQGEPFQDLIVMPYLEGDEVSIDCLYTSKGLIYVPRIKNGTRITEICYNQEIVDACHLFCKHLKLTMPFNIQFRYHENQLYLLEINTRMSGGIQLSSIGTGVNIPSIAINQLLGINKDWHLEYEYKKVTYIEKPLIL